MSPVSKEMFCNDPPVLDSFNGLRSRLSPPGRSLVGMVFESNLNVPDPTKTRTWGGGGKNHTVCVFTHSPDPQCAYSPPRWPTS